MAKEKEIPVGGDKKLTTAPPQPQPEPTAQAIPAETKADKFRRLMVRRLQAALKAISTMASLSNRSNYSYTTEQIGKVEMHISKAVTEMLVAFRSGTQHPQATIEI